MVNCDWSLIRWANNRGAIWSEFSSYDFRPFPGMTNLRAEFLILKNRLWMGKHHMMGRIAVSGLEGPAGDGTKEGPRLHTWIGLPASVLDPFADERWEMLQHLTPFILVKSLPKMDGS